MAKQIELTFPEKSASEVASQLGMSKARKERIFAIVEETAGKRGSERVVWFARAKSKAKKNGRLSARPVRRNNAKAAR